MPGCHNYAKTGNLPALIQADSLAESDPDSAYQILKNLEDPEKMAEHDFAYWCLLLGNIYKWRTDNYKKYLPSLYYERACRYYQQHGTTEQKSLIQFYRGFSFQETGDYNRAMQIYVEALKNAKAWQEYYAAGIICKHMGDLYQIEYLSDKCKEKYNESLAYFILANNPKRIAYAYAEIGFEYFSDQNPQEGLKYLLLADSVANQVQDSILTGDVSYYLGVIYNELYDFATAEQNLLKSLRFGKKKTDSITAYNALCNVYIASGDYQKARGILELGASDLTQKGTLLQRYLIEKGEQLFEQALIYLETFQDAVDSVQTMQKKMHTLEIEKKYNLEHAEIQKNKAQIGAFHCFVFIFAVLIAFLFMVVLYLFTRWRKNKIILEQREKLSKVDGVISHISSQLQQEKQHLKKAQASLQKTNKQYSISISNLYERINALNEELFTAKLEKIIQTAAIGKKVRKITRRIVPIRQLVTPNEWQSLIKLFRNSFPSLDTLLWDTTCPLTESEIRLSLLAFFNLDAKQESIIMDIAPVSVYKRRTRLRQKLELEEGTNLFEFFKAYCIEHE